MRILAAIFWLIAAHAGASPSSYTLLPDQSVVGFRWYLGAEPVQGAMPVKRAEMMLDFDNVQNSTVRVAVDVNRANAGAPFAADVMKGQSVLWAAQHPEIIFESTRVRSDGQGGAIITGNLMVRGKTLPQEFRARLFRSAGTQAGERDNLIIRLNGALSRSAYGADGFASFVGDRVELDIVAQIVRDD